MEMYEKGKAKEIKQIIVILIIFKIMFKITKIKICQMGL